MAALLARITAARAESPLPRQSGTRRSWLGLGSGCDATQHFCSFFHFVSLLCYACDTAIGSNQPTAFQSLPDIHRPALRFDAGTLWHVHSSKTLRGSS